MPCFRTCVVPSLVVFGLMLTTAGCERQAPASPAPAAPASNAGPQSIRSDAGFPLLSGTFTLTTGSGTLFGTYVGSGDERKGETDLRLTVTSGTGAFQGADGTLRGSGTGQFTGEGPFSLSLKGHVSAAGSHFTLRITVSGVSSILCDAGRVGISQDAGGTADSLGPVDAKFTHLVGNTTCF